MSDLEATPDVLDQFVANAQAIVDEGKLHFNADGLAMRAVDAANVAMLDQRLGVDALEHLGIEGVTVGLNLDRFADVLGFADERVAIAFDDETRMLSIESGGMDFSQATIDIDSIRQEPDIPDVDLPVEVTIPTDELTRAINAADLVGDYLQIGANADLGVVYFEADGDTDDVRVTIESEDIIEGHIGESVESLFSLRYLDDLAGPLGKADSVTLSFGQEVPLTVRSDWADGAGELSYLLAPRIQSD